MSQKLDTTHAVMQFKLKLFLLTARKCACTLFLHKPINNLFDRYNYNIFHISFLMELIVIGSLTSEKLDVSAQILSFADR